MQAKKNDLASLEDKVQELTDAYEDAKLAESEARGKCCTALNRLNEAQKDLDGRISEMRKNAPSDTDWFRKS